MKPAIRSGLLFAGLVLLASAPSPIVSAPTPAPSTTSADLALYNAMRDASDRGACDEAIALFQPRHDEGRPFETSQAADFTYGLAASCAEKLNRKDLAYRYLMARTADDKAHVVIWQMRTILEIERGDYATAASTIEDLAARNVQTLNAMNVALFGETLRGLYAQDRKEQRTRLLAVLSGAQVLPSEPLGSADHYRFSYVVELLDAGKPDEARKIFNLITNGTLQVTALADTRLKALLPADFDDRAAIERNVEVGRAAMKEYGDLLLPISSTAIGLWQLGRFDEALALLNEARARPGGYSGYRDGPQTESAMWALAARIYKSKADYAPMVEAFEKAIRPPGSDRLNLGNVVDLAHAQMSFGRSREARATLKRYDIEEKASPYGNLMIRRVRICAAGIDGKIADAKADLDFMKSHEADGPLPALEAYVCADELDRAARLLIAKLDSPVERMTTILSIAKFDDPLVQRPKDRIDLAWQTLLERADVMAAIERAGGRPRIRLQPGTFN